MATLLTFVLASYGLWFVVTQSELPLWHKLRDRLSLRSGTFAKLMLCPVCSGFWCSLAVAVTIEPTSCLTDVMARLVQALAGAAAVFLIEAHVTKLEER